MFRFNEGERVALCSSYPELGLKAGDTGTIWCLYATDPPQYEVTFRDSAGVEFDMTVEESELRAISAGEPPNKVGKQRTQAQRHP